MTAVTITAGSIKKHNAGDQTKVIIDISNVINAYTLTVPHLSNIEDVSWTCTTEADMGITISGNVLTFVTSSTVAGRIIAYGR